MRELNSVLLEGKVSSEIAEINSSNGMFSLDYNTQEGELFKQVFKVICPLSIAEKGIKSGKNIRIVGKLESTGLGFFIVAEHVEIKGY